MLVSHKLIHSTKIHCTVSSQLSWGHTVIMGRGKHNLKKMAITSDGPKTLFAEARCGQLNVILSCMNTAFIQARKTASFEILLLLCYGLNVSCPLLAHPPESLVPAGSTVLGGCRIF